VSEKGKDQRAREEVQMSQLQRSGGRASESVLVKCAGKTNPYNIAVLKVRIPPLLFSEGDDQTGLFPDRRGDKRGGFRLLVPGVPFLPAEGL